MVRKARKTAFYFIQSATTGFTVSVFPYPSRVSLKEAFAVLELCAGKLACTVLRGPGPSKGVWLLGATSRVSLKEAFEGLEPCDRETITHGS